MGPSKGGAQKGGAPKGEGPKISRFFSLSPATKFVLFFPLLGVFSWNFGGVFEDRGPEMCTFGVLGLSWVEMGFKGEGGSKGPSPAKPERPPLPPGVVLGDTPAHGMSNRMAGSPVWFGERHSD